MNTRGVVRIHSAATRIPTQTLEFVQSLIQTEHLPKFLRCVGLVGQRQLLADLHLEIIVPTMIDPSGETRAQNLCQDARHTQAEVCSSLAEPPAPELYLNAALSMN